MYRLFSLVFLLFLFEISNAQVCNLTYLTTIENFDVYEHNPSGAILYRAKFAVDADGSPRAYGPNNSGLDWTANAGYTGNWWGIVTDASGTPILQGAGDPYPGMYVSPTSLVRSGYSNSNPLRYVDSENIPYIALPSSLQSLANISKGDLAYVRNITNGNTSFAYFADSGPGGKLGEGSIKLADAMGLNSSPKNGGTAQQIIDYVVFPQSGFGQGTHLTVQEIDSIGLVLLNAAGGIGLPDCIDNYSPQLDCSATIPLTCGVTYSGASSSMPSVIETYGCNSWSESGPERVHSIVVSGTGNLTATVSNYSGDLDVYILGSCDPMDCLGTVGSTSSSFANAIAGETYYIVIDADDGSGSAYDLVVTCPTSSSTEDISLSNFSISSGQVSAGTSITVNATQTYSGSQLATSLPDFALEVYLSTDCNLSPDDTIIGVVNSNIGTDIPSSVESFLVNVPANTVADNYFILFAADGGNNLPESDEGNNFECLPIIVDSLVLDCFNAIPLTCGISFHGISSNAISSVNTYGCNTWTESGPERVHSIVPTSSGVISATVSNYSGDLDVYILSSCDPLDCVGSVTSSSATFSGAIAGQTYYVVVDADDGSSSSYDLVVNCQASVPSEDLFITNVTVSDSILMAGESFQVTADQNYVGNQVSANLPYFDLKYFLSTDCNLDSTDVLMEMDSVKIGSDISVVSKNKLLTLPLSTVTGSYFLLISADHNHELLEFDEINNVYCKELLVVTDVFVEINELRDVVVFPNPTAGRIHMTFGDSEIEELIVFNEVGKIVLEKKKNFNEVDLGKFETGIYFIKVTSQSGNYKIFKVIRLD